MGAPPPPSPTSAYLYWTTSQRVTKKEKACSRCRQSRQKIEIVTSWRFGILVSCVPPPWVLTSLEETEDPNIDHGKILINGKECGQYLRPGKSLLLLPSVGR